MTDLRSPTPLVPDVTPDPPGVPWRAVLKLLGRLPQGALSRGLGALADTPIPGPMRELVLGAFARAVGIDVDESERPLADYRSVNDFFVRRLKAGARTWPAGAGLVSPVDGIVGQVGRVEDGRLIQAKGLDYAAADLLGSARRRPVSRAARSSRSTWLRGTITVSTHPRRARSPPRGTCRARSFR